MKSILFSLFLTILPLSNIELSDDYVYGIGQTDSAAIVALARTIKVEVESVTSSHLTEKNRKINETFDRRISLSSSVILEESRVEYFNGTYYRYINKAEYVNKHYNKCQEYLSKGNMAVSLNLKIGNYYYAYLEFTAPLMKYFYEGDYFSYAEALKDKCKSCYKGLSLLARRYYGNGLYKVTQTQNEDDIVEFVYIYNGRWESPIVRDDGRLAIKIDGDRYEKVIQYRILYKVMEGGEYITLQVPEEFYFEELIINV